MSRPKDWGSTDWVQRGCGGVQELQVGHSFIDALPGDPDTSNKRRQVSAARLQGLGVGKQ